MEAIEIPKGHILLTKDVFFIPKNFVAIWGNPNKTRWWMFWKPKYRYSYLQKVSD